MTQTLLTNMNLARLDQGGDGPLVGAAMGDWEPQRGQAILCEGGEVAAVGKDTDLMREYPSAEVMNLGGKLLTPGLIDAHTHPAFVGNRAAEFVLRTKGASYEEILASGGGIHNSVAALRDADDSTLHSQTQHHMRLLKEHGVVALEAKSGYGLSLEAERRSLQAIHTAAESLDLHVEGTCLAAHVVPKEYQGRKDEYLDLVCQEILPALSEEGLISAADIFVEENAFTGDDLRRVFATASELGLKVHVHADQLSEGDGARLAAELRAQSADHCEFTGYETMEAMAKAGTTALLLPGSTFVLGGDLWAPARSFIKRDVPVVLATDFNPGSSPIMNPSFIMTLAVLKLRMSAHEALVAFTRNAAHCLKIADRFGSIARGKRAAFTLWEVNEIDEIPYWVGADMADPLIVK